MTEDEKLPFTSHLEELRSRLIVCIIAVGIGFIACFAFKEKLFDLLRMPMLSVLPEGETFIFTGVAEAFFTYLKVSFLAGLILAAPVIIFEFWMFVAPGLYPKEKHMLIPIVFLSAFFFIGGSLFGYFVVFPFGFAFFQGFANETIRFMPSVSEYLNFASKLLLAFGVVFELPILITGLARLGIVSVDFLRKNRKYAILIFFVGAAILTPPDVVTQIMMAIPLMLLYEISILGAVIFGKKKPGDEDADEVDQDRENKEEKGN
ncbi:MAG: twin-arginine translocase subunit TatC [Proteobacteria bacterium]|nr:twin-arginine translocase subunit TatC [Pseudomonadota bacterium]